MKKLCILVLLAIILAPSYSQSAEVISEVLEKETASYMDFSYLIASQLGLECTPFEAYAWCERFGTFPVADKANSPITVKSASQFFMVNYGLPGGLMWSATHSPRYAWRELKHRKFWASGTDPDNELSGEEVVQAVSRFFETYPDAALNVPPEAEADHKYRAMLLSDKEEAK